MRIASDQSGCDLGSVLILDEVITGFRVGPAGAAAHYSVEPDLATYGKVIGGGMPVGAYGGKRSHMEQLAPLAAHWSYNNASFYLAGHLIEQVTGQRFETALQ